MERERVSRRLCLLGKEEGGVNADDGRLGRGWEGMVRGRAWCMSGLAGEGCASGLGLSWRAEGFGAGKSTV